MAITRREQDLLTRIDDLRDPLVLLCSQLVQVNTVNPYSGDPNAGSEAQGQAALGEVLAAMGASIELKEPPQDVYQQTGVLGPRDRCFEGRPNLHARIVLGSGKGRTILINGHMDTVAATDMSIDPFSGEVRDGFIWGRGTSDCKGGLSAGVLALASLLKSPAGLDGTILLDSVVDEECNGSGAGTLAACLLARKPDLAIFMDGEAGRIITGCSGCLTAQVTLRGETAHGASGLGVSAIDKAILVKGGIDRFRQSREAARPNARTNLGVFRAGVSPAMVPGRAELHVNIVYELDEAQAAARETGRWGGDRVMSEFTQSLRQSSDQDPWLKARPPAMDWIKDLPPYEIPADHPLVQEASRAFSDACTRPPRVGPFSAWTDAAFPPLLESTPTVLVGPAFPGAAHAPDERVQIEDLVASCKTVALMLHRFLSKGD